MHSFSLKREWHLWFMLAVPFVVLGIIILIFAGIRIQVYGVDGLDTFIEANLPYILAINHGIVFVLLIWILKKNGLRLKDTGWTLPKNGIAAEAAIGLALGVLLYLFKELAYDSLMAVVAGNTPTFTSLFNFQLDSADIPMIAAATLLVFIEESVYRGFGLQVLEQRYSLLSAVIISSFFFGLLHWGNGVTAIAYTSVMGVLFALIYLWRNRNLIPVTIAHASYNFMILLT